ncbi:hypothetical protein CerSpe_216470 [Prunus speciosa]
MGVLWALWEARNCLVWQGVRCPPHLIVSHTQQLLHDYRKVNAVSSKTPPCPSNIVRWRCPPSGRLKINFDAAYNPLSRKVAIGVVMRNEGRVFVGTVAKMFGHVLSAEHVECLVAKEGVMLAISMGIESPIFEGDSLVVITAILRVGSNFSTLG